MLRLFGAQSCSNNMIFLCIYAYFFNEKRKLILLIFSTHWMSNEEKQTLIVKRFVNIFVKFKYLYLNKRVVTKSRKTVRNLLASTLFLLFFICCYLLLNIVTCVSILLHSFTWNTLTTACVSWQFFVSFPFNICTISVKIKKQTWQTKKKNVA